MSDGAGDRAFLVLGFLQRVANRLALTGASEAVALNEGFEEDGSIAVSPFPIVAQTPGSRSQNARRQIPGPDPRKDQEPGVVGNAVQIAPALLVVPADELVAWGHFPSGSGEAQGRQKMRSMKRRK